MLNLNLLVLYIKETQRTKEFYEKVFQETVVDLSPSFSLIKVGGMNLSFKTIESLSEIDSNSAITGGGFRSFF